MPIRIPLPNLEDAFARLPDPLQSIYEHFPEEAKGVIGTIEDVDRRVREITSLPEVHLSTPIGRIKLPAVSPLPSIKKPKFEERHKRAFANTLGVDMAEIVEGPVSVINPVAGEVLSDVVEDTHERRLGELLAEEEYREFEKQDAVCPSATIALLRMLVRRR